MTTDLVLRNAPEISDASKILRTLDEPLRVFVAEGPVSADGYDWWQVIPEGGNRDAGGWVAAAGKDGEEWLRRTPDEGGIWSLVSTMDTIAALDGGAIPAVGRAAVGPDGMVYIFGGLAGFLEAGPQTYALAFDPEACQWLDLPPLPVAQAAPHVVDAGDGRLYVIGSQHELSGIGDEALDLQIYDPASSAWSTGSRAPEAIAYGAATLGIGAGSFWALKGDGIFTYEAEPDRWITLETPPSWPDSIDDAAVIDQGHFAVLGAGASGIWRYEPGSLAPVSQLSVPRVARYNVSMVRLSDGRLAVSGADIAGGCIVGPDLPPEHEPAARYDLVDVFDPVTATWRALPPLPIDLAASTLVVIGEDLFVVGLQQTFRTGVSDPALSDSEIVIARYDPPAVPAGDPASADDTEGGCGG